MAEACPPSNRRQRAMRIVKGDLRLNLCTAYQEDGCTKGEACDNLHVCRNYILKKCKLGNQCRFLHDLQSKQTRAMFQRRFGSYPLEGETLRTFRELFAAILRTPQVDDESLDDEESREQIERMKRQNLLALKRFLKSFRDSPAVPSSEQAVPRESKPRVAKASTVTSPKPPPSTSDDPHIPVEKDPAICAFFLKGHCKFTGEMHLHPNYVHCSTPFQWQIRSGNGHWSDITEICNHAIERDFCDVRYNPYTAMITTAQSCRSVTIKFSADSFTVTDNQNAGDILDIRRLSTVPSVSAKSWQKASSTHWIWYRQNKGKERLKFFDEKPDDSSLNTTNDTIEKTYQKFRQQKGPAGIEITTDQGKWRLDFSHMKQTSLSKGPAQVHPLARRPKWKPTSNQCPSDAPSVPVVEVNSTVKASLPQKTPEESRAPMKKPLEPKLSVTQQIDHSRKPGAHNVLNSKTQDVPVSSDSKELNKPQLSACPSQKQHPDVFDSKKPQGAPIQETASSNGTRFKTLGAFVRPTGDRALHQDVDSQLQEPSSVTAESKSGSLPRLTKVASPGSSADKVVTNKSDASPDRERKECLEICLHYLKGSCQVVDDKYTHERHFTTPYQWQEPLLLSSGRFHWRNCSSAINDYLENEYSNVACDIQVKLRDISPECEVFRFLDLSLYRRLSTPSSVLASNWKKAFSIEWIWYWLDEKNKWIAYSEKNPKGERAGINSATIERKYLNYKSKREDPEIEFTAGRQNYKLDFAAMHQTNVRYGTCRKVRRRPKIVSMEERTRLSRRLFEVPKVGHIVPATWEGAATKTDMELVPLTDQTSTEYEDIAKLFEDTMGTRGSIISIKRVQNMELWEDFTRMSERMRKRNDGSPVLQMQLLHGTTTRSHAHAICRQNFDWRLSGSNVGTAYGKGSYFARDAKFAHRYTKPNEKNNRYLLVAQVLVGSCATGSPVYTRPPPKDPLKPHGDLYDSCVNDMTDPAIFVIFEKNQAYPEYLIKYEEKLGYDLASLRRARSSSLIAALTARYFLKP